MKVLRVLIGCECSGEIRRAMAKRGHFAVSVDLQPADDGVGFGISDISNGWHYQGDLLSFFHGNFRKLIGGWDLGIMHPECTYLTNAGVRWLSEPDCAGPIAKGAPRWDELRKAAAFYTACAELPINRMAIENPIMHCHASKLVGGKAHQFVQPWHFGHKEMKATGFRLKNLPELKPTNIVGPPPEDKKERAKWAVVHRMSPHANRSKERSRTYPGIAAAIADQWTRPELYSNTMDLDITELMRKLK